MFQTKLMREFRNAAGKMIVVYDYDESVASRSATTLAQRGYDNVLMLSGGLRVAEMKFPSRNRVFCQVHKICVPIWARLLASAGSPVFQSDSSVEFNQA